MMKNRDSKISPRGQRGQCGSLNCRCGTEAKEGEGGELLYVYTIIPGRSADCIELML